MIPKQALSLPPREQLLVVHRKRLGRLVHELRASNKPSKDDALARAEAELAEVDARLSPEALAIIHGTTVGRLEASQEPAE